jgi:glycerophosphoryl diester phosphodiesterase
MVDRAFSTKFFPIVVAHRGASSTLPENTLQAFEAAFELGAQVVELDVRLTADGVPVVAHDPDLARHTRGISEAMIHNITLGSLRRAAPDIPTLAEAFVLAEGRGALDLEIKNVPWDPAFDPKAERALEAALVLSEAAFSGPLLISSFNRATIERSRELAPKVPTGLLVLPNVPLPGELAYAAGAGHAFILPNVDALLEEGRSFVQAAHAGQIRVGTWVVDEASTQETMFRWGVDAVASNDPASAVAVLRRFRGNA